MAVEVKYIGGSKDGQVRRTRSTCDLDRIERIVWREFHKTTGKPTGRERRENYKLDHQRRKYVLMADSESSEIN